MNSFPMTLTRCTTVIACATLAVGAAGCSTVDRAGGKAADPVTTLSFAQANDGVPAQLQAWADLVRKDSHGSLQIEFRNNWRQGQTANEAGTIADVRSGQVDLGWVGARAFDLLGDTDFQALLAPMLVDSHDLQGRVFKEGIPQQMLEGVSDLGVDGVAVLPGPMRKVLGISRPFRSPGDFRAAVVGVQESELSRKSLEVLGATTKAEPSGANLDGLDAYEQQLASINGNGYVSEAKYVTGNLDLWPRPLVIIGNPDALAALTDSQRAALTKAGADAVTPALDASRAEDEDAAGQLCQQGMHLVAASDAQLAALSKAEQPVYDEVAAEVTSAGWLQRIRSLKSALSVAPDTASCDSAPSAADDAVSGEYRATIDWRHADVAPECAPGPPEGESRDVYELSLHGGIVNLQVRIGGPDATPEHGYTGTYRVFRDKIELTDNTPLTADFDVSGNRLVLSNMTGGQCGDAAIWTTSPWVRTNRGADELAGTWTTRLSASDWKDAGMDSSAGEFTLTFADGYVTVTEPSGTIGYHATYDAFRGLIVTAGSEDDLRASYRIDGNRLLISDLTVNGSHRPSPYTVVWTTHPFTRQR
jgi:TRAP-type C4-dicarboxylate transport system substrate-binding protein